MGRLKIAAAMLVAGSSALGSGEEEMVIRAHDKEVKGKQATIGWSPKSLTPTPTVYTHMARNQSSLLQLRSKQNHPHASNLISPAIYLVYASC